MRCFADAGIDIHMLLTAPKPQPPLMSFLKDGKNEAQKLHGDTAAVSTVSDGTEIWDVVLRAPAPGQLQKAALLWLSSGGIRFARAGAGRPQGRAEEMLR